MKKNIIRLTESELKNMIVESVKKILSEGMNDISSNTHYAIHKPTGKIVFSWDYTGYDPEDLKLYKKDYFTTDLLDMEMDPREITIITRKSCEKRGIDPTDDSNWSNYPMAESLKKEKERIIKEFNSILPYGNHITREEIIGSYKLDANTIMSYIQDDECGPICDEVKRIIKTFLDNIIIDFGATLYWEESTNAGDIENLTIINNCVDDYMSKIDNIEDVSDEAKTYVKQILNDAINDIDTNAINWE